LDQLKDLAIDLTDRLNLIGRLRQLVTTTAV